MNERIAKIKTHWSENKKIYLTGFGCLLVGTVSGIIFVKVDKDDAVVQIIKQIGFRNEATQVVIELVERSTPSKPLHLVGTNEYFDSLSDAARKTGHTLSQLSRNINGHIPDIDGDVFEALEVAV